MAGNRVMETIGLAIAGVVLFVLAKALEVAIEKEYTSWASALARLCIRLAGLICHSRSNQWLGDLIHDQEQEQRAFLYEAFRHLVGAPGLAVSETVSRLRTKLIAAAPIVTITNESDQAIAVPAEGGHIVIAPGATARVPSRYAAILAVRSRSRIVQPIFQQEAPIPPVQRIRRRDAMRQPTRSRVFLPPLDDK
jgi:hypothetical protein